MYPWHRYGFLGGTEVSICTCIPEKPVAKPVTFPKDITVGDSKQKELGREVKELGDVNNGHMTPDVNVNKPLGNNSESISGNDDPRNIDNASHEDISTAPTIQPC